MRSTHVRTLGGLTAVLLIFTSVSAFAGKPPTSTNVTPGQGGNIVPRPTTFGVDRSPMSTSVGNVLLRNSLYSRLYIETNFPQSVSIDLKADRLKIAQAIGELLQKTMPPGNSKPKDSYAEEFGEYFQGQLKQEARARESMQPYRDILKKSKAVLESTSDTNVVDAEKRRLKAMFIYASLQFVKQRGGYQYEVKMIEQQVRSVGSQQIYNTNFLYSNSEWRFDAAAQYFYGAVTGYGASFNYDLFGVGVYAYDNASMLETLASNDFDVLAKKIIDTIAFDKLTPIEEGEKHLAKYLLKPLAGLNLDYRNINNSGKFYQVGVTSSILYPLHGRHSGNSREGHNSEALFFSIGWRHDWYEADPVGGNNTTKGVGVSAIAAWQDASPYFYTENGNEKAELARWNWRAGVEYAQHNAVSSGDYIALFARWRDHNRRATEQTPSHPLDTQKYKYDTGKGEIGLQLGVLSGYLFGGASIGYYFK